MGAEANAVTEDEADVCAAYLASPLAEFRPWEKPDGTSFQRDFILAAGKHHIRIARAGNRCGKTVIGTVDTLLAALGQHPAFPIKPPLTVWVSALDWNMVAQVQWPEFKKWLPKDAISSISYLRKNPETPLQIKLKNGSQIDFKSADSTRKKYQGAQVDLIWLDEEHPADIVEECQARLLDTGGLLTVTATPVMRSAWLQKLEALDETFCARASTLDAAHAGVINLQRVLAYAESLPERQRRVRVYGDLVALEGAVYPTFDKAQHVARVRDGGLWLQGRRIAPWPLPRAWPRYAAVDFGISHPMAVLRAAHCEAQARLFIERCWWSNHLRYSKWAEILKPELGRLAAPLICDHDASGRGEFEHVLGKRTLAARKAIQPGIELVEHLLEPKADGLPAIVLVEDETNHPQLGRQDCRQLRREMENYHYPEDKEGKPLKADQPVKKDDDCCDALRYLCAGVVQWIRLAPNRDLFDAIPA